MVYCIYKLTHVHQYTLVEREYSNTSIFCIQRPSPPNVSEHAYKHHMADNLRWKIFSNAHAKLLSVPM